MGDLCQSHEEVNREGKQRTVRSSCPFNAVKTWLQVDLELTCASHACFGLYNEQSTGLTSSIELHIEIDARPRSTIGRNSA